MRIELKLHGTLRGRKAGTSAEWAPIAYEGETVLLTGEQYSAGNLGRETLEIAIIGGERFEVNVNEVPGDVR
jgi:hypothetical protein